MGNDRFDSYMKKHSDDLLALAGDELASGAGITSACFRVYGAVGIDLNIDPKVVGGRVNDWYKQEHGKPLFRLLDSRKKGKSSLDMMDDRGIMTSDEEEMERRRNGEPSRGYGAPAGDKGRPGRGRGNGKRVVKSYKNPTI